ncbi:3-dehydroquinate synthase [Geomicrobium halophilum]|uniref:3-dehydroquinate synthase n=1 Tax=Geomicrobium halophilum TaxID=549000 RepID=A0A841Q0M7_9BACL|nr:3-dehydroquinate synthase [Geomicrobium halophilum]MBB6449038.1 3-dehydroquinate synthase [Geomicrobium halophilum]
MKTVKVKSSSYSYTITIGRHLRKDPCRYLPNGWLQKKNCVFIITDENVAPLYLEDVQTSFSEACTVKTFTIPAGEQSKSFSIYEKALTACLRAGLDRNSAIVALGGGVVGDLAGFVAATYMRGISLIQMPTTLLAHDSSVGGKTGINHPEGKNMIGAFHQPDAVLYDVGMLDSLSRKEWLSGLGEVIKHGYIADQTLIKQIRRMEDFSPESLTIPESLLASSIVVKKEIVNQDEREKDVRAYLNFGHTLAHALEQTVGYGVLTHGEAVVNGMVFALYVAKKLGYNGPDAFEEIKWLQRLGYSFTALENMEPSQILSVMKKDKKTSAGNIRYVVLTEIEKPTIVALEDEHLLTCMDTFKEELHVNERNSRSNHH